jgi:hypothetical protein
MAAVPGLGAALGREQIRLRPAARTFIDWLLEQPGRADGGGG